MLRVLGIRVRGTTTISRLTGLLKLDACNRHHPLQRSCMDNIRQCLPSCTMQCSQPQPWLLWEPLRASRGSQEAPAAISARAFLRKKRPFCIWANIQIFQSRARGLEDVGSAPSSCFGWKSVRMINCAGTATFADDDAVKMSATEIYQHVAMGMPVSLNDQHCQHVIAILCLGGPADTRRTCFHCCHESATALKHSGLVTHRPCSSPFGALMKAEQAWRPCTEYWVPCPGSRELCG